MPPREILEISMKEHRSTNVAIKVHGMFSFEIKLFVLHRGFSDPRAIIVRRERPFQQRGVHSAGQFPRKNR